MDRPVTIGNVHNMSLENFSSERPHLATQFFCETEPHDCISVSAWIYRFDVCCATFWLHDVHSVTFKGMILTVQTPNVSGVIFRSVSKVSIQWVTTYSSHDHYCFGIGIREAYSTDIQSSSACNCTYGVVLENTTNSQMNNTTAMYNMWGVVLLEVSDSRISNTIVIHNSLEGMYLGNTSNIHIANTTASFNRFYGMHLWYMFNTYISYTTATHNSENGMFLDTMDDVHITNTIATHNSWNGMSLHKMNNIYITNIMLTFNGRGDYYGGVVSSGQVMITLSAHTQIYNSSFTDVNASTTATTADPNSQPAIIVLYQSTLQSVSVTLLETISLP